MQIQAHSHVCARKRESNVNCLLVTKAIINGDDINQSTIHAILSRGQSIQWYFIPSPGWYRIDLFMTFFFNGKWFAYLINCLVCINIVLFMATSYNTKYHDWRNCNAKWKIVQNNFLFHAAHSHTKLLMTYRKRYWDRWKKGEKRVWKCTILDDLE